MKRLYSIDYLRGIMALSVVIYHYIAQYQDVPQADTVIGRLGIYAVSAFYVISGISLFLAYGESRWGFRSTLGFIIKRFFRIAPLFWLASILMVLLYMLLNSSYMLAWDRYFYNFSLSFGFYHFLWYLPMGGWSIGNEIVFYTIFPFLILSARNKYIFSFILLLIFLLYAYFAFSVLDVSKTVADEWVVYINPLNQMFLFAAGVGVGFIFNRTAMMSTKMAWTIFLVSCTAFVFYPASGNQIGIVTGWGRIVFTIIIIALCFSSMYLPADASTKA